MNIFYNWIIIVSFMNDRLLYRVIVIVLGGEGVGSRRGVLIFFWEENDGNGSYLFRRSIWYLIVSEIGKYSERMDEFIWEELARRRKNISDVFF